MNPDVTLYKPFFNDTIVPLVDTIASGVNNVASGFIQTVNVLFTIYIILWAWSMARGMISEPITDGISRIVRLSIIYAFALVGSHYSDFFVKFFWEAPDAMASLIPNGRNPTQGIEILDEYLSQYWKEGERWLTFAYQNKSKITRTPDLAQLIMGFMIIGIGILLTGYAAFLYFLSKLATAVLLILGPAFILCVIFDATKRIFDAWLGLLLNYFFVAVLTSTILFVLTDQISKMLIISINSGASDSNNPPFMDAVKIIGMSMISLILLLQVSGIASSLGGGVAISTLGAGRMLLNQISSPIMGGMRKTGRAIGKFVGERVTPGGIAARRERILRREEISRQWKNRKEKPSPPGNAGNSIAPK